MLVFLELTPRFKKLKESSVLQNGVWDFQNSEYLKSYRDFTSFSETQANRFVKQTIPI